MTPGFERLTRSALRARALRVAVAGLVCWVFVGCDLNPRPEPPGAGSGDKGEMMTGSSGGSPNSEQPGAGGVPVFGNGGGPSAPPPRGADAGLAPGEPIVVIDGGSDAAALDGGSDAADGKASTDPVTVR